MKRILLSIIVICCAVMMWGQTQVTTHPFIAQGANAALARATFTGTNISERGFCWATHENPTIEDNHSTKYYINNGNIYEMSPLEAGKFYYCRAYAKTNTGEYVYGDVVKFVTKPQGNNRWSYDYAGDEATNNRIESAIKHSIELYNAWTSIQGFHLNCHYVLGAGAGDGTADCSYGGWMRVSQNVSYQRTGTLLHESNHGVGVGTSDRWWNGNLRANGDRGDWLGERATNMVRFFENNTTATLHGDNTHMWPYGINGAHEDHNSEIEYIANVLITHALHEDGLAPIPGGGFSPAYTFAAVDTATYYITTEDASYGKCKAYLYDAAGTLKWKEYGSLEELNADDRCMWNVTFDPATSYYRIRNVKTKRYFTYSGSAIKTASRATPSGTEYFHLLGSRENTTLGEGKRVVTTKGYWIMAASNTLSPYSLTMAADNATGGAAFDIALSARNQRWFILSADELKVIMSSSVDESKAQLRGLIDSATEMLGVPHTDNAEGATAALQSIIDDLNARFDGMSSMDDINLSINSVKDGIKAFIANVSPTDITKPFDITCLISEPDFSTRYDWDANGKAAPTIEYGIGSVYEEQFKFTQTLTAMPKGTYMLRAQAYQCPGEPQSVAEDWANGKNNAKTSIFFKFTSQKTVIKNIFADAPFADASSGDGGEGLFEAIAGKLIPMDSKAAAQCFEKGLYDNFVVYTSTKAEDTPFGIVNSSAKAGTQDKTVFSNFRLYFYGGFSKADVQAAGINAVQDSKLNAQSPTYNLAGQRVSPDYKGVVIRNGKKLLVR